MMGNIERRDKQLAHEATRHLGWSVVIFIVTLLLIYLLCWLSACSPKKEIVNTPIGFGLHKYDTVYGTQSGPFGTDTIKYYKP